MNFNFKYLLFEIYGSTIQIQLEESFLLIFYVTFLYLQQSAIEKYNIAKVNFDQIFTGSPPDFPSSKKLMKTSMSPPSSSKVPGKLGSPSKFNKSFKKPSSDKKGRQESMDKFLKKTDKSEGI